MVGLEAQARASWIPQASLDAVIGKAIVTANTTAATQPERTVGSRISFILDQKPIMGSLLTQSNQHSFLSQEYRLDTYIVPCAVNLVKGCTELGCDG